MTNETFKKLEYILSGYQVSKEEINDLVDLIDNFAKEYHEQQLRLIAVVPVKPEKVCVCNESRKAGGAGFCYRCNTGWL